MIDLDDDGRKVYQILSDGNGMAGWKGKPFNLVGFLSASIWLAVSNPYYQHQERFNQNLEYILRHLDEDS